MFSLMLNNNNDESYNALMSMQQNMFKALTLIIITPDKPRFSYEMWLVLINMDNVVLPLFAAPATRNCRYQNTEGMHWV